MIRTKDFTTLNKIAHNKAKKPLQRSKSIPKFNPKKEYTFDEYVSFLPKDKVRYLESKNIEIREPIYILYKGRYGKYEINATNPFTGNPIKIKPSNGFINKYERKYQSPQCYKIFYIRCHLRVINKPKVKGSIIVFTADNHTDKKFLYKTIRLKKRYLRNNHKSSNRISLAVLNKFRVTVPSCDEDDDCDYNSTTITPEEPKPNIISTAELGDMLTEFDYDTPIDKHFGKHDFLVCVYRRECRYNPNHRLVDVKGVLECITDGAVIQEISFYGAYCPICGKYYVLRSTLDAIGVYGYPMSEVLGYNYSYGEGYDGLRQKSKLRAAGYSLSEPVEYRRNLLVRLVASNQMSIIEICSHLNWLIERSYYTPTWFDCTDEWVADRDFISNYDFENIPRVKVDHFIDK